MEANEHPRNPTEKLAPLVGAQAGLAGGSAVNPSNTSVVSTTCQYPSVEPMSPWRHCLVKGSRLGQYPLRSCDADVWGYRSHDAITRSLVSHVNVIKAEQPRSWRLLHG